MFTAAQPAATRNSVAGCHGGTRHVSGAGAEPVTRRRLRRWTFARLNAAESRPSAAEIKTRESRLSAGECGLFVSPDGGLGNGWVSRRCWVLPGRARECHGAWLCKRYQPLSVQCRKKGIRMQYRRLLVVAVATITTAALAAGCSSSKKSSSGNARGPITFVTGKDTSGVWPAAAAAWNKAHPNEKVTVKQQSDQADQQHDDIVQHMQSKDAGYDIVTVDVIWTAEFAAKGWLVPLKDKYSLDTSSMLAGPVKAATYNGTLYAAPFASDGGLLYYRKDLVPTPPTTWSELVSDCSKKTAGMACYAGQFSKYEGLTVNAAEAINSAGGEIVKSDGKTPNVDTSEAKQGLDFLVNGFKQGYIAKEAITYTEEPSRVAFQSGKLLFLRNWPYVYAHLTNDADSKVKA